MTHGRVKSGPWLSKWYMDCIGADGECMIAYWARASWREMSVTYGGLLRRAASGEVESRSTLRPGREPLERDGEVRWACGALGISGEWHARGAPIVRELWRGDAGKVRWSCIAPAAEASVMLGGRELRGPGYVERIEMTVAPWRLPIRELRWGRWIGPRGSLVWIDWRGGHPLTLIAADGREASGTVGDIAVQTSNGDVLELARHGVIRSGKLGATVLGAIPGLGALLPDAILSTQEDKWIGRSERRSADGAREEGWAIHEIVRFGLERP